MGLVVGRKLAAAAEAAAARAPARDRCRQRRRAHAGRHVRALADGPHRRRDQEAPRRRVPYISVLTDPTTGGVVRLVRQSRRCHPGGAGSADRLCRPARGRGDDGPAAAARQSPGRVPARPRPPRRGRATIRSASGDRRYPRHLARRPGARHQETRPAAAWRAGTGARAPRRLGADPGGPRARPAVGRCLHPRHGERLDAAGRRPSRGATTRR